jgi:hypothetical protein
MIEELAILILENAHVIRDFMENIVIMLNAHLNAQMDYVIIQQENAHAKKDLLDLIAR